MTKAPSPSQRAADKIMEGLHEAAVHAAAYALGREEGRAEERRAEWQPIETAPNEGSILVYSIDSKTKDWNVSHPNR